MLSAKKIAAGKRGQIEAIIKTDSLSGPIEKRIEVATNDPHNPSVMLSVRAVVEPEIEISDATLFFDDVPAGQEAMRETVLTIRESRPIRILAAVSEDKNVVARLETVPGSDGRKTKLVAVLRANAKPGYHFGSITVKTSSRRTPRITVYVRGLIAAPKK